MIVSRHAAACRGYHTEASLSQVWRGRGWGEEAMTATDVVNLVSALIRPAIVVLLVLLFRDPIRRLLERLKPLRRRL
jgi:hypothetical protein